MEAKLEKIDSSFIDRKIVSKPLLNFMKGTIWGSAWAISQSVAGGWYHARKVAGAGKALDPEVLKSAAGSRAKAMIPIVAAHTAAFTLLRGNGDTRGLKGLLQPLAIVAAPTVAYAAFYRSAPPAAMVHGVLASTLLHAYDRMAAVHGETLDVMPVTKLHRRGL